VRILLDTNAYSDLKRGITSVAEVVRGAESILFSVVVVGELLYGFRSGSRYAKNLRELGEFLERPSIRLIEVSWVTAERYARIAASLRRKGTPLPVNDMWIAAHAMEAGADLVSRDRHFGEVDGLAWIDSTPA